MHLLLWAEDSEKALRSEVADAFPASETDTVNSSLLKAQFSIIPAKRLPQFVFSRQLMPDALELQADSIRGWAGEVVARIAGVMPDEQPWFLHVQPQYAPRTHHRIGARAWHTLTRVRSPATSRADSGDAVPPTAAGLHRCQLIRNAIIELLQKKRRHLLRNLRVEPEPFSRSDSLVQVLLTEPQRGFVSVALAPLPFEQNHLISAYPKGEIPVASDKQAPSRAFAKLLEAEARMGLRISSGESCVDLGASPGSWSYVALNRGARITAVDRTSLRDDLMTRPNLVFHKGDAFRFKPQKRVDWLLCDVIASPEQTTGLLLEWLRQSWCRHFIVTIKMTDVAGDSAVAKLKRDLPALARRSFLSRLCANKKEVCAFGSIEPNPLEPTESGARCR